MAIPDISDGVKGKWLLLDAPDAGLMAMALLLHEEVAPRAEASGVPLSITMLQPI